MSNMEYADNLIIGEEYIINLISTHKLMMKDYDYLSLNGNIIRTDQFMKFICINYGKQLPPNYELIKYLGQGKAILQDTNEIILINDDYMKDFLDSSSKSPEAFMNVYNEVINNPLIYDGLYFKYSEKLEKKLINQENIKDKYIGYKINVLNELKDELQKMQIHDRIFANNENIKIKR